MYKILHITSGTYLNGTVSQLLSLYYKGTAITPSAPFYGVPTFDFHRFDDLFTTENIAMGTIKYILKIIPEADESEFLVVDVNTDN